MTTRLADGDWVGAFREGLSRPGELRVASPFVKLGALTALLDGDHPIRLLTRYNLGDFAAGASDLDALDRLLTRGARIRGVKGLHAKLYVFGNHTAVVTSANLTVSGLGRNHEFGMVSDDGVVVSACQDYFDGLWADAGEDLQSSQLAGWKAELAARLSQGDGRAPTFWPDYGAEVPGQGPFGAVPALPPGADPPAPADQAFIKLLGTSRNRVGLETDTVSELDRSLAHWAVAYPAGKRPRQPRDNDRMFIARLTHGSDIRIFGQALALRHDPKRDDATPEDIALRSWKRDWPHYIRVHHAEFVAGPLANGVSLRELTDALGPMSFASTKRNLDAGGNVEPGRSYRQQASIRLSREGWAWLDERLAAAFLRHGRVPADVLRGLPGPAGQPGAGGVVLDRAANRAE